MNNFQKVNKGLREAGVPVKLYKGGRWGSHYIYFTYRTDDKFETESIYWNSIDEGDVPGLIEDGKKFAAAVEAGTF